MSAAIPLREIDRRAGSVLLAIADDTVRTALARYLAAEKLTVLAAATGADALEHAGREPIGCAVIDLRTLDRPPADLVPRLAAASPGMGILALAGPAERETAAALTGLLDILETPVRLQRFGDAVRGALRRRDAIRESDQINAWLREEVARATTALEQERRQLEQLSVAALEALVNALEAKDHHLRGHSSRVARLARWVAAQYGLDGDAAALVEVAGRLHDIGKIGIREDVLSKQGPLTNQEFEHIKQHPEIGARILEPLTHLRDAIAFVRSHHEHWDGGGYPDGMAGEAIPIGARIIGAAEIYDALTTSRPYQTSVSPAQAVDRMRELVGTVLDPAVFEALERAVRSDLARASEAP